MQQFVRRVRSAVRQSRRQASPINLNDSYSQVQGRANTVRYRNDFQAADRVSNTERACFPVVANKGVTSHHAMTSDKDFAALFFDLSIYVESFAVS
jgi:hypothetical protein